MDTKEPGQADAELEADIAAFRTEMEHWNKPPRDAALTVRILAERTRDKERIEKLEAFLRYDIPAMPPVDMRNEARALLEVQDGK